MRIVVASPPRAGNHWIKCLLASVYGLQQINGRNKPVGKRREVRREGAGLDMPDAAIFHQHCVYSRDVVDAWSGLPAHVVTILRDPYDMFLSYHRWSQEQPVLKIHRKGDAFQKRDHPREQMVGKPLDSPETLAYLADGFGQILRRAVKWSKDDRVLIVRYELLHHDPVAELVRLTGLIEPVPAKRIEKAIRRCSIENMRVLQPQTVKVGAVGRSRDSLTPEHLRVFRNHYGHMIRELGYDVL
ncbi:MAG: sulfotransferase domain-containing protein [Chloroflexota bacterium]